MVLSYIFPSTQKEANACPDFRIQLYQPLGMLCNVESFQDSKPVFAVEREKKNQLPQLTGGLLPTTYRNVLTCLTGPFSRVTGWDDGTEYLYGSHENPARAGLIQ